MREERVPVRFERQVQKLLEMVVVYVRKDPDHLSHNVLTVLDEQRPKRGTVFGWENILVIDFITNPS